MQTYYIITDSGLELEGDLRGIHLMKNLSVIHLQDYS